MDDEIFDMNSKKDKDIINENFKVIVELLKILINDRIV